MKRSTRLYNVILPVWLLGIFPQMWLIILPGNLLIDCLVLLLALCALKHTAKKAVLKELWWKFWLLGFAADFVGVLVLSPSLFADFLPGGLPDALTAVFYNPFENMWAFLWIAAAVAAAGACIYFFDRRTMRKCELLSEGEKHRVALAMALATAPWTFFIPMY